MIIRAGELFDKEVICIKDGTRLGNVGEFELNTETGRIETVIIPGRARFFGLLGREEDVIIPFSCIEVFGEELILVNISPPDNRRYRKTLSERFRG